MTEAATGAKMAPAGAAVRYRIDAGLCRFTVRAFAAGLFSALGHNPTMAIRDYTGEATIAPGSLEQATLRIAVQSASLEVTDDISQKDRADIESKMRQEVLETSMHPEIVFESSQVLANKLGDDRYAVNVSGNLTLHGVTRSETIYAQVTLTGDMLRAFGEFPLRQTDYGIKLVSVAGGTLKVKDEVKVTFDLTGRKQG
jgi:polyisoprenoid-binding protein YceI